MSDIFLIKAAQFIYLLWPVFILAALFFAFQGIHFRRKMPWFTRLKAVVARMRFDLFATWTFLFFIWMVTLFASGPNESILPEPINSQVFFGGYALIGVLEILPRLNTTLRSQVSLQRARSLKDLKEMDPYRFEDLVTATYRGLGYKANHVGHSGDHGVDIEITTPSGEYWIAQCKRYHGTVGESIIRDLYGSMVSENARRAILVTTAEITPPAHAWARGKPIELVDGPRLLDLINEARARREGSLFARLARWWISAFASQPAPETPISAPVMTAPAPRTLETTPLTPALGQSPALSKTERTQPVRTVHPAVAGQPTAPLPIPGRGQSVEHTNGSAPICPVCGVRMVHHPPRATDRPGRTLYRCRNYPACRVVLDR